MTESKYVMLAKYVLPSEMGDYFDIEEIEDLSDGLHLYLEEKNIAPEEYKSMDFKIYA